jgi:hypothetical protein
MFLMFKSFIISQGVGSNMSFVILGFFAGILSGIIGIGGGIIIVPALIYLFKFPQQLAQGTTLALLVPPIGVLAAWTYYKQGFVDLKTAGLIVIGFFIGGLIGAIYATNLNTDILRKIFAIALVLIGIKMFLQK